MNRQDKALAVLQAYKSGDYLYLGEGVEGVVFTDRIKVYKIYDSKLSDEKRIYLELSRTKLYDSIHLYYIEDIILFQSRSILIYQYEESEPISSISEEDFISFLAEIWQKQLIFSNIRNPRNFIRVNGVIKLVDPEFKPYTDNLFLNMCVRAFIQIKYFGQDECFIKKLAGSAVDNFNLPELKGVQDFVNRVFSTIIFRESKSAVQLFSYNSSNYDENSIEIPFNQIQNLESLFYTSLAKGLYLKQIEPGEIRLSEHNYFEPSSAKLHYLKVKPFRKTVSLLIKTCAQDYETIYAVAKHIVKQLSAPDTFFEKIPAVDSKEKEFTREYTDKGTFKNLMAQVNRLIEEKIMDRYVILPAEEIANINYRWFGLNTNESHCTTDEYVFQVDAGVPVTPQLYAFEQAKGEYIFQMDSDVMIARRDLSHSYLEDMVSEMEKNEKVVSVGFNICQDFNLDFKPYFGFEDGGFIPEVRMGLFHRERLFSLRPFPNKLDKSGKLQNSWYRAMQEKQKDTGFCCIRGGDCRSFYIHPQNYRKADADVWTTILDRTESGFIPDCQQNEFDLAGSYYDWTIPKRNEKLIVLCRLRNVDYSRFLRMFCSVFSQTYQDWGMIIIDDASDNGLPLFIENIIRPYLSKITFIKNRVRQGLMANMYKPIHYFMSNPESVVAVIDGDDAIIGNRVFWKIMWHYEFNSADVVIGRTYQTFRLQPHYRYPVNFLYPRDNNGGNVWQHIRTFKKYLFDSLEISDLKLTDHNKNLIRKVSSGQWIPICTDYATMVPIMEMSRNPLQVDYFTYYYEREPVKSPQREELEEQCIADILNKEQKHSTSVFKGRKTFQPDLNKIEIDITYECNLNCIACNRSCAQAPGSERIDLTDIKNFVRESIELNKKWELISILGGEPTLHPDFEAIVKYISENYILKHSPETLVQIVSNGFTETTRTLLEKVKVFSNLYIDYKSFKADNRVEYFTPFNNAPVDDENYKGADYHKACWVTAYCGIGLNKFGYYGCSICGGIDRVINKNRGGIKALKDVSIQKFQEQFRKFCCLCGNFKDYAVNYGNFIPRCEKAPLKNTIVSAAWEEIYNNYREGKT